MNLSIGGTTSTIGAGDGKEQDYGGDDSDREHCYSDGYNSGFEMVVGNGRGLQTVHSAGDLQIHSHVRNPSTNYLKMLFSTKNISIVCCVLSR